MPPQVLRLSVQNALHIGAELLALGEHFVELVSEPRPEQFTTLSRSQSRRYKLRRFSRPLRTNPDWTNEAVGGGGPCGDVHKQRAAARPFSSQCVTKTRFAFRGRWGERPSVARRVGRPTTSPRRPVPDSCRCHQSP